MTARLDRHADPARSASLLRRPPSRPSRRSGRRSRAATDDRWTASRRPATEADVTHRAGDRRGAASAADRAAVVGVRQLRDPVQGVRPAGRAARPVREDRRRRAGPPLHRRRADGRAPHPVGQGRRLRRPRPPRRGRRASPSGRSTRTRSRTTTTCSAASATPTPRVRRKAVDHLLECVDIMDATGSRDLKLWFADGTNYPGQDDIRGRQDRLAEALAVVYDRLGDDQRMRARVQVLRAVVLHDRRARLGHRARPLPRAGPEGARSSSTPATTRPARTSSSSSRRCCAPGSSARSTSTRGSTPTTT